MKANETTNATRTTAFFAFALLAESRSFSSLKGMKPEDQTILLMLRSTADAVCVRAMENAGITAHHEATSPESRDQLFADSAEVFKAATIPAHQQAMMLLHLRELMTHPIPKVVANFCNDAEIILRKSLKADGNNPGKSLTEAQGLCAALLDEYNATLAPLSAEEIAEGEAHTAMMEATGGLGDVPPGIGLPAVHHDALAASAQHSEIVLGLVTTEQGAEIPAETFDPAAMDGCLLGEGDLAAAPTSDTYEITPEDARIDAEERAAIQEEGALPVEGEVAPSADDAALAAAPEAVAPVSSPTVETNTPANMKAIEAKAAAENKAAQTPPATPAPGDLPDPKKPMPASFNVAKFPRIADYSADLQKKLKGSGVGRGGFLYLTFTTDPKDRTKIVSSAVYYKHGDVDQWLNGAKGWEKVQPKTPAAK